MEKIRRKCIQHPLIIRIEVREVQSRLGELKKLREELETNQLAEEFEAFRKDFPEQAETMKPSNTYIKGFEKGGVGYRMWVDEFRKLHVKTGNS